jgi:histone acetyltransferase (RNA polymerase elongator complex component)
MKKNSDLTEEKAKKRKRKNHFSPYKKDKYSLSKLKEYENYLEYLKMISKGGNLEM